MLKRKNGKPKSHLIGIPERKTENVREERLNVVIGQLINIQMNAHAEKDSF